MEMSLFNSPFTEIGLAMIVLIGFYLYKKGYQESSREPITMLVDDYMAVHGVPIDVIALDSTRCNELNAVILVYENDFVIDGMPMPRNLVSSVTYNNSAVPGVDNRYQIVIRTGSDVRPILHLPVGADANYAGEVLQQLCGYVTNYSHVPKS